jgi:hypothetical protein
MSHVSPRRSRAKLGAPCSLLGLAGARRERHEPKGEARSDVSGGRDLRDHGGYDGAMELMWILLGLCIAVWNAWFVWRVVRAMDQLSEILRELRALKSNQHAFNAEMLAAKDKALRQGEQTIEALVTIQETQEG